MNVALVGAGFAGRIHLDAWANVDGSRVSVVVDADEERARALAALGDADWDTSFERVLERATTDVVDICTPTALHAEYAILAAQAGKHVLCEKPISISLEDADRSIDACRQAGVAFMVGHVLRFWHEYEFLKGVAEEGTFGSPHAVTCTRLVKAPDWTARDWLLDPSRSLGAGEVMIHDLDFVCWLLGRPRSVSATGRSDKTGWSHMQALLRYDEEADVLATIEAGWDAPEEEPFTAQFRAVFDEAIVEYDSRRESTLAVSGRPMTSNGRREKTAGGPWSFDAAPYFAEIDYFAECIKEGSPPSRCPPEEARQALEFVLAIFESASSGREVTLT